MPKRDGTGPMGTGAITGRGFGPCAGNSYTQRSEHYGRGRGHGYGRGQNRACGRGFGRGFYMDQPAETNRKEVLEAQKSNLQRRLEVINDELEKL